MNGSDTVATFKTRDIRLSKPFVLWLTGLSGAGKSTVARRLTGSFRQAQMPCEWLDGDVVREAVGQPGFSREERDRHLRYVGLTASLLERHGIPVIASFVSPYRATREAVRALCQNYIEVYLSTDLKECERRDTKGLYRRARAGQLAQFTGISSDYEAPAFPDLTLNTAVQSIEECVVEVLSWLSAQRYLQNPAIPWAAQG